jgi:hypothetical protein
MVGIPKWKVNMCTILTSTYRSKYYDLKRNKNWSRLYEYIYIYIYE